MPARRFRQHRRARRFIHLIACIAAPLVAPAQEPELAELVRLNGPALFGGPVRVDDGRVRVDYLGEGRFEAGFECRNDDEGTGFVSMEGSVRNVSVRKVLLDGADGKFSFAALNEGLAISRFWVGPDWKATFRIRLPVASSSSRVSWIVDFPGDTGTLTAQNFNDLRLVAGRERSRSLARAPEFRGPLADWFDRKSTGVLTELQFQGGKFTVRMESPGGEKGELKEVASIDGIPEVNGCRLAIGFDSVSFLVSDFRLEAALSERWARSAIEKLREQGRLQTGAPGDAKPAPEAKGEEKKKEGQKESGEDEDESGPDLDRPDPESEIEL